MICRSDQLFQLFYCVPSYGYKNDFHSHTFWSSQNHGGGVFPWSPSLQPLTINDIYFFRQLNGILDAIGGHRKTFATDWTYHHEIFSTYRGRHGGMNGSHQDLVKRKLFEMEHPNFTIPTSSVNPEISGQYLTDQSVNCRSDYTERSIKCKLGPVISPNLLGDIMSSPSRYRSRFKSLCWVELKMALIFTRKS